MDFGNEITVRLIGSHRDDTCHNVTNPGDQITVLYIKILPGV